MNKLQLYGDNQSPPTLFIIEDSEPDYEIFMRIVKKSSISCQIQHFETGEKALDYLQELSNQRENEAKKPQPSVILLDLNLPGINGKKVIEEIRLNSLFKLTPVVVFTTSSNPKDIEDCYLKGANSYTVKSMDFEILRENIQNLLSYWLKVNIVYLSNLVL